MSVHYSFSDGLMTIALGGYKELKKINKFGYEIKLTYEKNALFGDWYWVVEARKTKEKVKKGLLVNLVVELYFVYRKEFKEEKQALDDFYNLVNLEKRGIKSLVSKQVIQKQLELTRFGYFVKWRLLRPFLEIYFRVLGSKTITKLAGNDSLSLSLSKLFKVSWVLINNDISKIVVFFKGKNIEPLKLNLSELSLYSKKLELLFLETKLTYLEK